LRGRAGQSGRSLIADLKTQIAPHGMQARATVGDHEAAFER